MRALWYMAPLMAATRLATVAVPQHSMRTGWIAAATKERARTAACTGTYRVYRVDDNVQAGRAAVPLRSRRGGVAVKLRPHARQQRRHVLWLHEALRGQGRDVRFTLSTNAGPR
jgi:hypothetical protein